MDLADPEHAPEKYKKTKTKCTAVQVMFGLY